MTLSFIDYIIVGLYFASLVFIGYFASRGANRNSSKASFLLNGRQITLPVFVATLVATWYGSILGVGEFAYRDGIVEWLCLCFFYYISALAFAYFAAGKVRRFNFYTIPEQIAANYGRAAGTSASVIVLLLTVPASYVLMLGVIIQLFTGWGMELSCTAGAIISFAFLLTGGFRADVLTNTMQFVIMYLGFGVMAYFLITVLGSPSEMLARLPESHKSLTGDYSWQYIVSWFVISLQTFVDPSFHQRCAAAKSPDVARRGVLISVVCWVVFDLLTLSAGLYARAYFEIENPVMAFPALAEGILPIAAKGLFVTALLAVVMSTLTSYFFISGATIGNDILPARLAKRFGRIMPLRLGLGIAGVLAVLLALAIPSAIDLIYKTSSIAVPGLIVPLLFTFTRHYKLRKGSATAIMTAASGIALVWTVLRMLGQDWDYPLRPLVDSFEPMVPAIVVAFVLGIIFTEKSDKIIVSESE